MSRIVLHGGFWCILGLVLAACDGEAVQRAAVTSPLIGAERIRSDHQGQVVECLRAGSYTYLRLDTVDDRWFVTTRPSEVGNRVALRGYAELEGFRSRRLSRSFDRLVFASIDPMEEP